MQRPVESSSSIADFFRFKKTELDSTATEREEGGKLFLTDTDRFQRCVSPHSSTTRDTACLGNVMRSLAAEFVTGTVSVEPSEVS